MSDPFMERYERDILERVRWASARSKVSADNEHYYVPLTIRDADDAADEIERLRAIVDRLPEQLRDHWRFNHQQQPLSSWHDREDFIERWKEQANV